MINKLLQKIRFKKEELKDNKDWISLLDIFNRNPQLLLDFAFNEENGGMGITNEILEKIYENSHHYYSKKWSWILEQKKLKIETEIQVKASSLTYFKSSRDHNKHQQELINNQIQELETEFNELQKNMQILTIKLKNQRLG